MSDKLKQDTERLDGDPALARPYARAIFELARSGNSFDRWNEKLALMAAIAGDDTMKSMLDDPRLTRTGAGELMIKAGGEDIGEQEINLLKTLAENNRLDQLAMIDALYRRYRDEGEGTVDAEVISALPLSESQKAAISSALKQRLGRDVLLNCSVNEDLVGGAVIRAGDLVIDGSAVEYLRQLSGALVH